MHERVGGGSIQARLLLLHRSSNLPKYGMLTVKRKKEKKSQKRDCFLTDKKEKSGEKMENYIFFLKLRTELI